MCIQLNVSKYDEGNESLGLLSSPNTTWTTGTGSIARKALNIVKAFFDGSARTYAMVGAIALVFRPNLIILTAVFLGGVTSAFAEVLQHLESSLLEQEKMVALVTIFKWIKEVGIRYVGDVGTLWSLFLFGTTPIDFSQAGIEGIGSFSGLTLLLAAMALAMTITRYLRDEGNKENQLYCPEYRFANFCGDLFRGISAPVFLLLFLRTAKIAEGVGIPLGVIAGTGAVAGSAIYILARNRENRDNFALSQKVLYVLELLVENPSWAISFSLFTQSIVAKMQAGKVPLTVFYLNMTLSAAYWLILTTATALRIWDEHSKKHAVVDCQDEDSAL